MQRITLIVLLLTFGVACSPEDLADNGNYVRARVMWPSCGGTVLQFIDSTTNAGKDWPWFKDLNEPIGSPNIAQVYPNCVSAFDIPRSRQVVGDTLEFTYRKLTGPSGLVCAIGGLPSAYISVKSLKTR